MIGRPNCWTSAIVLIRDECVRLFSLVTCASALKIRDILILQQGYQSMDTEENAELFDGH